MEDSDCFPTVKVLRISSEVKNSFENCKIRYSTEGESGKMFEMLCKFKTQNQHVHQIEKTGRRTWQQIEAQTFGSHQAKAFPRDLTEDCAPQRVHVSHFPENQIQFCTLCSSNLLAIQTKYRVEFSTNRFGAIILPSFILAEHITNQVCSFEFLFYQLNKIQFSSIVFEAVLLTI